MLSVLIPVYNYNISNLVLEIHKQAKEANITFEIICFNDNSKLFHSENISTIDSLEYTKIINSDDNVGRIKARQILCNNANFDWLLFLDADVIPKSDFFIENYLSNLSLGYEAYFGGFAYTKNPPKKESILRWKYGKKCEEIDSNIRNMKPHQLIISANFLIKKKVFDLINQTIDRKSTRLNSSH